MVAGRGRERRREGERERKSRWIHGYELHGSRCLFRFRGDANSMY